MSAAAGLVCCVARAAAVVGAGGAAWHNCDTAATSAAVSAADSNSALAAVVEKAAIGLQQWRAEMAQTLHGHAEMMEVTLNGLETRLGTLRGHDRRANDKGLAELQAAAAAAAAERRDEHAAEMGALATLLESGMMQQQQHSSDSAAEAAAQQQQSKKDTHALRALVRALHARGDRQQREALAQHHAALSEEQRIALAHHHGVLTEQLAGLSNDQRIASAQRRADHGALSEELDALSDDQHIASAQRRAEHVALAGQLDEVSYDQLMATAHTEAVMRQDHDKAAAQRQADHGALAHMHMMADAKWQQQANRHHVALTEQLATLSKGHVGQTQRLADYVRFTDEARRRAREFDAAAQKRHRAADAAQRLADHGAVTRGLDALAGEHDVASARHARALAELSDEQHHHGAASTQQHISITEALAKLSAAQHRAHVAQLEEGGRARTGRWRHDREFAAVRGAQRDEEVARIVAGGRADAALVALGLEMRGDHATDKVRADALAHTVLSEMGRQRGNHDAVMQQLRVLLGKEEDDRRSFDP
jgi:hypothetical protein